MAIRQEMICMCLAFLALSSVSASYLYKSYTFTPSQQQQIIEAHNQLRRLEPAANMQELVWDDALAFLARDHASKCDAWHRDASERRGHGYQYIGENIWWSTERFLRFDLKSVIRDFYDEKPFFDFNSLWCKPGEMCGHYTQVVWAETCAVGCAASYCDGITNGRGIRHGHIVTCNYGEGGNAPTQPYIYGSHCSHCPGPCTADGLCASMCRGRSFSTIYSRLKQQETKKGKSVLDSREKDPRELAPTLPTPTTTRRPPPRPSLIRPETADNVCRDYQKDCAAWGNVGECERNRDYMNQYCRKTCNFCRKDSTSLAPRAQPQPQQPPPQSSRRVEQKEHCIDKHLLCPFWSTINSCVKNPAYMQANCFMSCNPNICPTGIMSLPASECKDKNADCDYWTSIGECEKNPLFMNWQCPRACSYCKLEA